MSSYCVDFLGFSISCITGELQRQVQLQQQLQEDRERLQEDVLSAGRAQEKSNEKILELQESVRDLSAERAELSSRLAQEEKSTKELRRNLCEAQKQAEFAREELSSAGRQLKMERDVHQRELTDLRSAAQTAKAKHERNIQEMLAHFRQEREELESHIRTLKVLYINTRGHGTFTLIIRRIICTNRADWCGFCSGFVCRFKCERTLNYLRAGYFCDIYKSKILDL